MRFSYILPIVRPIKLQVTKGLCKRIKNISHNNHSHDHKMNFIRQYNKKVKVRLEEGPSSWIQMMPSPPGGAVFLRSLLFIWLALLPRWKKCASSFNPMSFQLQSNKKKMEKDLFLSDVMYSLAWADYWINNSLSIITALIPGNIVKESWSTIGKKKVMWSITEELQLTSKCLTENLGRVKRGRVF